MIGELYPGEFDAMEHNGRMDALEQEPCDVFDEYGNYKYPSDVELTEPNTATSMPCEDAVSRQAVCNIIDDIRDCVSVNGYWAFLERLKKQPPVNPQPKTGHWIDVFGGCECSECGCLEGGYSDYCPNCGAKMIEPQESEVSNADSD